MPPVRRGHNQSEEAIEYAFPPSQKPNLLDALLSDLDSQYNVLQKFPESFRAVAANWIGYDEDDRIIYPDGSGDRGIDGYMLTDDGLTVFQFKSQNFTTKRTFDQKAGPDLVGDVSRILHLIQTKDYASEIANKDIKQLLSRLQTAVQTFSASSEKAELFKISIKLHLLYDGLTKEAESEIELLRQKHELIEVFNQVASVDIEIVDISKLLTAKWLETNTKWVDATGRPEEWVQVSLFGKNASSFIDQRRATVFYGRARDFIDAYRRFGYQVFETNVRCEIRKSAVNDAIKAQVTTDKGVDEFLYLNNGLTITCMTKTGPRNGVISIHKPQIVNGLQTVTSLKEAYDKLAPERQQYFDEHCYLLVRLYEKKAIADISKLVTATNNQNKMETRNLKANEKDQILFEQLFARLGWFYERKDFAWQAYEMEPSHWSNLKTYHPSSFKVKGKVGRPLIRRVDNLEIGQTWLAFVGYVDDAAQRRKLIFDKTTFYNRVFAQRMRRHAFDYDYKFDDEKIKSEIMFNAPSSESLLLANLTYKLAKALVPTASKHRENMIDKKGLRNTSAKEIEELLFDDIEYVSGLAKATSPFLFTEMCGFILLRAFDAKFYEKSGKILTSTDIARVFNDLDYDHFARAAEGQKGDIRQSLFKDLWLLFDYLITDLVEDERWRRQFFVESSKPRIMYRDTTRKKLLERVVSLDKRCQQKTLEYDWADHFSKKGIFNAIKSIA